jgi:hypothetical protein
MIENIVVIGYLAIAGGLAGFACFMIGRGSADAIESLVSRMKKGKSPSSKAKAQEEKYALLNRIRNRRNQIARDEARIARLNDAIAHFDRCNERQPNSRRPELVSDAA